MTLYNDLHLLEELSGFDEGDSPFGPKMLHDGQVTVLTRYFDIHRTNQILNDAYSGKRKIQDALMEMESAFSGRARWLPTKKDGAHNARLDELGVLVSPVDHLRKRGRMYPDNPLTVLGYGLIAEAAVLPFVDGPAELLPLLISVVSAGYAHSFFRGQQTPYAQACYVDEKLALLE